MTTKRCARCRVEKPTEEFTVARSQKDGLDKYCRSCRHEAYVARRDRTGINRPPVAPYVCETCGKEYMPCHKRQRFCGRSCARRTTRLRPVVCGVCLKGFRPKYATQKFCSKQCKYDHGIGNRRVRQDGYVLVRVPRGTPGTQAGRGWMHEHRYMMQQHLGRPLARTETVHHVNGKKGDNRIGNLQLRTGRHGKNQHLVCCDCGSENVKPVEL